MTVLRWPSSLAEKQEAFGSGSVLLSGVLGSGLFLPLGGNCTDHRSRLSRSAVCDLSPGFTIRFNDLVVPGHGIANVSVQIVSELHLAGSNGPLDGILTELLL